MGMYMCVDLKSFYASVECVDLGLDPMTTPLVVADASRGKGAITLAITPALKALGVKNRCRLFQIPPSIDYITVKPRMKRYMDVSAQIYGILLQYVSADDVHVYSIDEQFIDITSYLQLYHVTPVEFGEKILTAIRTKTGIYGTVGLGTNLFLAKVALDVLAKHSPNCIAYLDEARFKEQLWHYQPITDIWRIGPGTANRLRKYGVYDLHGITQVKEDYLYKEFGVDAELLIDHAWGRESCTIQDIKAYRPSKHSICHSQILLQDYQTEEARLPLQEMVEHVVLELLQLDAVTNRISLHIGYGDNRYVPTGGSLTLMDYTDSYLKLSHEFLAFFEQRVRKQVSIRKLSISLDDLIHKKAVPVSEDLFALTKVADDEREYHVNRTMLSLKKKFGGNVILRASSLQDHGTAQFRNTLVGGHNSGDNGKVGGTL